MNDRKHKRQPLNFHFGSRVITIMFLVLVLLVISGCVSSIHQAAETGDIKRIEALLEENPSLVNEKDSYGMTPLHWAVDKGHRGVAALLIEKGADVNATDRNGDTPLRYAVINEYSNMATMLMLKGAEVSAKEEEIKDILKRIAPLHCVAREGHLGHTKTFLAKYPDLVNAQDDEFGRTPLYWAARADHIEVCEVLLANGADINAATPDGWTPLHTAVYNRKTKAVELLVEKGADVNVKNRDGETPLHWAARRGKKNLVEPLLAKGADVNARDNNGKTPLDWALDEDNEDIAEILRQHSAGKSRGAGDR